MEVALNRACDRFPRELASHEARKRIAAKLLERVGHGERTLKGFTDAGLYNRRYPHVADLSLARSVRRTRRVISSKPKTGTSPTAAAAQVDFLSGGRTWTMQKR